MKNSWIDQPTVTRKGEELNFENLRQYVFEHIANSSGDLMVQQFPGGFSNLTYLVSVGSKEYVLRKPLKGANVTIVSLSTKNGRIELPFTLIDTS